MLKYIILHQHRVLVFFLLRLVGGQLLWAQFELHWDFIISTKSKFLPAELIPPTLTTNESKEYLGIIEGWTDGRTDEWMHG